MKNIYVLRIFFLSETSILPSPSSLPPWLTPTPVTFFYQDFPQTPPITITSRSMKISPKMTPPQDPKNKNKVLYTTIAHSLKAALFHTMALKLSLEINNDKITS